MLELKHYQEECLDALTRYLRGVSQHGRADTPFSEITGRDYLPSSLPEDLRGVPYVCLRVPTGGGKTLIAAHAVPVVTSELLRAAARSTARPRSSSRQSRPSASRRPTDGRSTSRTVR